MAENAFASSTNESTAFHSNLQIVREYKFSVNILREKSSFVNLQNQADFLVIFTICNFLHRFLLLFFKKCRIFQTFSICALHPFQANVISSTLNSFSFLTFEIHFSPSLNTFAIISFFFQHFLPFCSIWPHMLQKCHGSQPWHFSKVYQL